ncbi:hypothetical protein Cyast_1276 [Cyanobacterium stanieri PCC 7202]|uniref:Uncharacterized protein n=1 Tax=Cyanobacterium stanieri (strain ATCC 29140 / PCC 7202) TaxID=292563 RepID=K9YJW9_CYASC|nr:hypothetical protein Cyast_1276 [Cyanobacterium stanieri PCC 7202]
MKSPIVKKIKKTTKPVSWIYNFWFDNIYVAKLMALVSLANLGVVAFDLTYIPLRDIWLNGVITVGNFTLGPYEYDGYRLTIVPEPVREVVIQYDAIKGIEPYRDTQQYLETVAELQNTIDEFGLDSPQTAEILEMLREMSAEMIAQNPFELANKSGNLERVKNIMRDRMEDPIDNPRNSATIAFESFWDIDHLEGQLEEELTFFNEEIAPLINTNYFRPIGESGQFVDYFGLIDFPFIAILFADFLVRSFVISLRYSGVKIQDAIFWRWYDLIFFLPTLRWLRIIPVSIRLDESKIICLTSIKRQASQGFVASIAGDITEVIILRVINQLQHFIKDGYIEEFLSPENTQKEYINFNNTNEIAEITKLLIDLVANQVLPEIRPEVEDLLNYIIEKSIIESPAYQSIAHLPGLQKFPQNISQKTSTQIYSVLLKTVQQLLKEDPVFDDHVEKIITKSGSTLTLSVGAKHNLEVVESLLYDLLEEIKINYVRLPSDEEIEALLDETRALRQIDE